MQKTQQLVSKLIYFDQIKGIPTEMTKMLTSFDLVVARLPQAQS